ncbi:hypothetical protein LPB67_15905 [Undibacterium sp. Jales W-56]|uniref:hypothetical protein n=1 Tax=Undibacterium sp. Jales W-56 TaxID=2897325 RepID=UPI0021D30D31|nr:hypothetical protein [Undibacterium sp. Jales W-56]MCU6435260.1 hypothetical protein [Undibacterium sp. Jales W-56]
MKHIAASRTARYIMVFLQGLLLLAGTPQTSVAQGLSDQMEMRGARQVTGASRDTPEIDCQSYAFCCLAPPVPVRASRTPDRLDVECAAVEYRLDVDILAFSSALRMASAPMVALRLLYCCWRN